MTRRSVVDGQFYPRGADELRSAIESYTPPDVAKRKALGALCPHAGYVFSGPVAGRALAASGVPDTVVLLTPSHKFAQPAFALWTGGDWQTPLGRVALHDELTTALAGLATVTPDDRPHMPEHSGEVVVPFLQYHNPDVRLAVVCITAAARLATLKEFGAGLANALEQCGAEGALVVASSDMSHESGPRALETVNAHDSLAIAELEKLDPDGLYRVCGTEGITMCGVLPAAAMMASVAARGGARGELIARATSANSPYGRGSYVVGYAGMLFA